MKRLLLFFCLLIASFGSLMVGPVDQQKAAKLGAKFMSTTSIAQKNTDIQLQLVSTVAERDAVDYYVFNVANGEGTMWVGISNSLGQTIMETTVEGDALLDLSRFDTGLYIVRIKTENGLTVQKVNLISR